MIWQLEHVTLPGRTHARLDGVSVTIPAGITAVLGPSGAGKSSLLNLLVGFERPAKGSVRRCDLPTERLACYWVPQSRGLWPELDVRAHLDEVAPRSSIEMAARRDELLERCGLDRLASAHPDRLSAGEQDRLALARAVMADASVLVMDEPLANVDRERSVACWHILRELHQRGTSIVFASHVAEIVLREAQYVIGIHRGQMLGAGALPVFYDDPPNEIAAGLLGPANWFEDNEAEQWLLGASANRRCYRPEQITVTATDSNSSKLMVRAWRRAGSLGELQVIRTDRSECRTVWHCHTGEGFSPGERVALSVSIA